MKQKNFLKIAMLFVFAVISNFSFGQLVTTIDFETLDSGYTLSDSEGSTFTDVFNRIDRTGNALGGNNSFLFAVEDTNLPGESIQLTTIDVSGSASFTFSIDMLAHHYDKWDNSDELLITYSIDGGADQNLMWVQSANSGSNEPAALDLDFDGIGDCGVLTTLPSLSTGTADDCASLTNTFETFITSSIDLTSNSTLDIKLQFNNLTSGDEGIYIDDIVITETAGSSDQTIGFDAATSTVNETDMDVVTTGIPVTFSNYTADATITPTVNASSTADAADYTIDLTPLTFTADGTLYIPLTIKDDADFLDETVIIDFTVTTGTADLGTSQHTVTITDDEIPPVPAAGTVFITEVSDAATAANEYIEIYNNSNESVSVSTSKLVMLNSGGTVETIWDFDDDIGTASIPARGFLIITRGGTQVSFEGVHGSLNANTVLIQGTTAMYFGTGTSRRWRLYVGGTVGTADGTLIDDTEAAVGGANRHYQNVFTDIYISDSEASATPGTLEYLVYSGGAWVNTTAMDATTAAKDAYIYDDYTVSANAAANNLGINTGNTLTIGSSVGLDVDGNLTVNGNMSINSGGSLIVSGTSTGNVTYNRTLDFVSGNANGWHLISSPLAAQTYNNDYAETNGLATSGTKRGLAFYNDALASGSKYTYLLSDDSNTSSFNTGVYSGSGIGYSAKRASTTGTVAFTGTINTDDVNGVAVSTSGDGFNLLGVPYTSYISSQTFLTDNSNLEQTQIWVWEQGVTGGNFIAMTAIADNFILAPGQGFFVKAASGTTVNFAETNQTANADTFLKSSRTEVKLLINDGESNRFAKVYFLNNVTKGFDSGYEGETFGGIKNSLDLFSQLVEGNQGKKYQVQSLPKSDLESMVIPIGVIADAGKEITFTADAVNLSSGLKVFLEDTQTNIFTRLDEVNSEYKITLTETLNGVGRFYMHTTASVLSTEDIILNSVRMFKTNASTLKITGLPKGKTSFYLYNILGKEMMTTIFTSNGNKEISLSKLASGIYLAKIQTEKGAISKKIILE